MHTGTAAERILTNGLNIGIQGDTIQIAAIGERITADLHQCGGEIHPVQKVGASECTVVNISGSLRHGVIAVFSAGVADQVGSVCGEQHTVYRLIGSTSLFHDELGEAGTAGKDRRA